jgi:hypothetical protein
MFSLDVMTATGIWVHSYQPTHEVGANRRKHAIKAFRHTGVQVM